MKAPIDIDVTGELVVQVVAAFARSANPSAVLNRVAQALDSAAEQGPRHVDINGRAFKAPMDSELLCEAATRARVISNDLRAIEDAGGWPDP